MPLISTRRKIADFIINNFGWQPYSNLFISAGRSLLALSTFLTLLINDSSVLFHSTQINENYYVNCHDATRLGLFCLMQNNLEGARIILLIITVPAIFGLLPAVSSLLHLYAAFSVSNNTLGIEGGDQLIVNLITLLAISSICDYRLTTWLTIKQNIPRLRYIPINILYCFIYIQVSYVYFEAAIAKAVNPIWGDGTALWYWVQNDGFGISADAERLFLNILSMPIVSAITTWGTILLELLFSFSILAAKNQLLRYTMVACAINFHFIIAIIMGLTTFFISMTGALLLVASTPLYLKIKNPLQEETHLV